MSSESSDKPAYTFGQLLRDLESGKPFQPVPSRMPGIDRVAVLCDKRYDGTGLTVQNIRRLRADLCEQLRCRPADVEDFPLHEVVNTLTRIPCNPFLTPDSPLTTWNYIPDLDLRVRPADCRVIKGYHPSVCPKADPPLPCDYLPVVVETFRNLNRLPEDSTIHWIGYKAWLHNLCDCDPANLKDAQSVQVKTERAEGAGAGRGPEKGEQAKGSGASIDPAEDKPPKAGGEWLTVSDAAKASGCTNAQISGAVRDGQLKSNGEKGRKRRIDAADLALWQLRRAKREGSAESDATVAKKLKRAQDEKRNYRGR